MKYYIFLTLASVATAAKLDKVYLPPNAGSSSGASAGLQAPFSAGPSGFAPSQNAASYNGAGSAGFAPSSQNAPSYNSAGNGAEILRYDNEITDDGYHYAYETSDGTKAEQEGRVIPGSKPEEGSLQISGSYSYVGDDGQTYTVTYTADENGYRAEGAHLPTPPPVPEAILKSLQLNDGVRGQYDSQKSSYDADAGY